MSDDEKTEDEITRLLDDLREASFAEIGIDAVGEEGSVKREEARQYLIELSKLYVESRGELVVGVEFDKEAKRIKFGFISKNLPVKSLYWLLLIVSLGFGGNFILLIILLNYFGQ